MIDRPTALTASEMVRQRDAETPGTSQADKNPDILLVNPRPFLGFIRGLSLMASIETPWLIGRVLESANQLDPATIQRMHEMSTGVGYITAGLAAYMVVNFAAMNIRAKHPIPA